MGDYEHEQKRLQNLWDKIMSDENDSASEFGDVYLSDEYSPGEETSSTSSSDVSEKPHKCPRSSRYQETGPSTSQTHSDARFRNPDSDREVRDTVAEVIEDVITQHAVNTDDDGVDKIKWRQVDKLSLKHFDFTAVDVGIKANFYEEYINKSVYDVYKLFVTDEIIHYMVQQTNLYAEQVLRNGIKPKSRLKNWIPITIEEMEKFIGLLLWMGLVKQPKLRNYWSRSCLYTNQISATMSRNGIYNGI